jgi:hypothetical protein
LYDLIKRKTGGQPGNHNARKHGFYSKVLPRNEKRGMKFAAGLEGIDQEIAVLRIKFRSLLAQDGQNLRLINQTVSTLARMYTIKYSFSRNDSSKLKEAVSAVLEEFIIPQPPEPDNKSISQPSSHPEGTK